MALVQLAAALPSSTRFATTTALLASVTRLPPSVPVKETTGRPPPGSATPVMARPGTSVAGSAKGADAPLA